MNAALKRTIHISQFDCDYNIPPQKTNIKGLIDRVKASNHISFSDGEILYSSNCWDFSKFIKIPVQKKCLRFNFSQMRNSYFLDDVKNYVLLSILENRYKIQSIYKRFITIKNFFLYMEKHFFVTKVTDISEKMIEAYIVEKSAKLSLTSIRWLKATINAFYLQYSANFTPIVTPSILQSLSLKKSPLYKGHL